MKLSDRLSCDSFATDPTLNMAEMSLAHELTSRCRNIMLETANKALLFTDTIDRLIQSSDCDLGPWSLNSISLAATIFAWLEPTALAHSRHELVSAKDKCVGVLHRANWKWKVAGESFPVGLVIRSPLTYTHGQGPIWKPSSILEENCSTRSSLDGSSVIEKSRTATRRVVLVSPSRDLGARIVNAPRDWIVYAGLQEF